jgi:hypothetical protein
MPLLLGWLLLQGCDLAPGPAATRLKPEQVALQTADLPPDLQRCPNSGPIDRYLADLKSRSASGYQAARNAWNQLKGEGASGAAVAVYGTSAEACSVQLGAGPGRSAASVVAVFDDQRAARAAYQHGILGFPTPAAGQQAPGLSQGVATGLSENAWTVQRDVDGRRLYAGFWQERAFTVFFVSTELDASESQRAAAAMEQRIR